MTAQCMWSWLRLPALATLIVAMAAPGIPAQEIPEIGRIAHIEGQVLRHAPGIDDWVPTVKDTPFGLTDTIHSTESARAEFIVPNGIWFRTGENTQVQAIALYRDASEIDVANGTTRFYNKSSSGLLKVTSPFGYVLAEPGTTFDLYVGDRSAEAVVLDGKADFVNAETNSRTTITAGGQSIIADKTQAEFGDGAVDAEWDDWNGARDTFWAEKTRVASAKHLPDRINDTAHVLEENGRWERVYYNGVYREFWRPTTVEAHWQPFTGGRWTDWNGDQCWVPDEPFGYVTHHYGNWVAINTNWYWAPPVETYQSNDSGCAWYPGRVAWVSSESEVGWIPLAPAEAYYAHNYWGPQTVVVELAAPSVLINIGSLAFYRSAVIIPVATIYTVHNYHTVRVRNVHADIITRRFHSSTDVNRIVSKDSSHKRYHFTNADATHKPHRDALRRVEDNRRAGRTGKDVSVASFKQALSAAKPSEPVKGGAVCRPKLTSSIVSADRVNSPKSPEGAKPVDMKKQVKPAASSSVTKLGRSGPGIHHPAVTPARPGDRSEPGNVRTGAKQHPTMSVSPTPGGKSTLPATPASSPPTVRQSHPPAAATSAHPPALSGKQLHGATSGGAPFQTGGSVAPPAASRSGRRPPKSAGEVLKTHTSGRPEHSRDFQSPNRTGPTRSTGTVSTASGSGAASPPAGLKSSGPSTPPPAAPGIRTPPPAVGTRPYAIKPGQTGPMVSTPGGGGRGGPNTGRQGAQSPGNVRAGTPHPANIRTPGPGPGGGRQGPAPGGIRQGTRPPQMHQRPQAAQQMPKMQQQQIKVQQPRPQSAPKQQSQPKKKEK